MSSEKTISILLTKSELDKVIRQTVTGSNKELVAQALSELFDDLTTDQVKPFIQAALGIIPQTTFFEGDQIFVDKGPLSEWEWNNEYMEAHGYLKNNKLKGVITGIRPFSTRPYRVQYIFWHEHKKAEVTTEADVSASYIELREEFPEDF